MAGASLGHDRVPRAGGFALSREPLVVTFSVVSKHTNRSSRLALGAFPGAPTRANDARGDATRNAFVRHDRMNTCSLMKCQTKASEEKECPPASLSSPLEEKEKKRLPVAPFVAARFFVARLFFSRALSFTPPSK